MIPSAEITFFPLQEQDNHIDIKIMIDFFGDELEDYNKIVNGYKGLQFLIYNKYYFEIWEPRRCIETYQDYMFKTYLPNVIPIGGDGGDNALVFSLKHKAIFLINLGDLDEEEMKFISQDLSELIISGIGLNRLWD